MGLYKCTIGSTDVSAYLEDWSVEPGIAGAPGTATLTLAQQAGGLDIRPRMDVKLWVPFDTGAGTGIASRGRVFGGLVSDRDTGNAGTTKTWDLPCEDWNSLLDLVVRDMQPAKMVTVTAGTFAAQIQQLVNVIQWDGHGTVAQSIDATTGVASLYASMPAVTMEPGHKLGYYIQYLCNTVKVLSPGVIPRFFIGWGNTFGAGDTFGGPVLWIYDYAATPSPAYVFSDTPTGSEKPIYGQFRRTTSAGAQRAIQRRQGFWGTTVYTAENAASQSTYPNPYINHGETGNKGFWMLEPIDIEATTTAEAQAAIDASVASTANPSDTIEFETYEWVQPYDPVAIEWALESITSSTVYRIASLQKRPEGVNILTRVQLNNRRRGLYDDGSDEYPMLPVEGDPIAPLPISDLAVTGAYYDYTRREAVLPLSWSASASPDTAGYKIYRELLGEPFILDVGNVTEYDYRMEGSGSYELDVRGYDRSLNIADPSNVITGTSPGPVPPATPVITGITSGRTPDGTYTAIVTITHSGDHSREGYIEYHQGSGPSHTVAFKGNASSPFTVPVKGLHTGTYLFNATVQDQYGQFSNPSTPDTSHTITITPIKDPDPVGWEADKSDDPLRGMVVVAGSAGDLTFSTAVTPFSGKTSGLITEGAGGNSAFRHYMFAVPEGAAIVLRGARKHISGTSTKPNAALKYQRYAEDNSTVGSEGTVFDAAPTTSWVEGKALITWQAGTKYIRAMIQSYDAGGQSGTHVVAFSEPRYDAQIIAEEVPSTLTLTDQTIAVTGTAKITGGGGLVELGTAGLKVLPDTGTPGANNIDFYNEVGVRIGHLSSSGATGSGVIELVADYNGLGTTVLGLQAVDSMTVSAGGTTFTVDSAGATASALLKAVTFKMYTVNGATITDHLSATASLNFPNITAQTAQELSITVTGVAAGDTCIATPNGALEAGLVWSAYCKTTDIVTIRVANFTTGAIDPAARTWRADAWKH